MPTADAPSTPAPAVDRSPGRGPRSSRTGAGRDRPSSPGTARTPAPTACAAPDASAEAAATDAAVIHHRRGTRLGVSAAQDARSPAVSGTGLICAQPAGTTTS
nr:hypothetical protein [Brevibacterium aurantiacum]